MAMLNNQMVTTDINHWYHLLKVPAEKSSPAEIWTQSAKNTPASGHMCPRWSPLAPGEIGLATLEIAETERANGWTDHKHPT